MGVTKKIQRVAVTGAAGQIAYSLLFQLASGSLLGQDQPIILHLVEIPSELQRLMAVVMELEDCAFPLLKGIVTGSNPNDLFKNVDYVFLVGAKPRGPGMERHDLIRENAQIFKEQGKALKEANRDAVILVVGNPCNTNCLIALKHALNPRRVFAMSRLDELRARAMLAKKAGVPVETVSHMAIWGNHSVLQVPDYPNARIGGEPVSKKIPDESWLENVFVPGVEKRGAEVLALREKSSAASAAVAAIDAMRTLINPTPKGEWFSMGLLSDGNPYGISSNLVFSFPCVCKRRGEIDIVPGLSWTPFIKKKIALVEKELLEERAMVEHLL